MLQKRAAQEKEHMLAFNFFPRLTPFAPNWFINMAAPVVGIPIVPFFIASLVGTQVSLFFLSITGQTLREAAEALGDGETFDNQQFQEVIKSRTLMLGVLMAILQCIPGFFIWIEKRKRAAEAAAK